MVSSSTDVYKEQFLVNVSFSSVGLFDQWLGFCMKYKKKGSWSIPAAQAMTSFS